MNWTLKHNCVLLLAALMAAVTGCMWLDSRLTDMQRRYFQARDSIQQQRQVIDSLIHRTDSLATVRNKQALWTTRAIVSETKKTSEMRPVAHTVRNRYERGWRGAETYREVVLQPLQFSAFRPSHPRSRFYRTMTAENTPYPGVWRKADSVARRVVTMPKDSLMTITHFIHPRSLDRCPTWTARLKEVPVRSPRMRGYIR